MCLKIDQNTKIKKKTQNKQNTFEIKMSEWTLWKNNNQSDFVLVRFWIENNKMTCILGSGQRDTNRKYVTQWMSLLLEKNTDKHVNMKISTFQLFLLWNSLEQCSILMWFPKTILKPGTAKMWEKWYLWGINFYFLRIRSSSFLGQLTVLVQIAESSCQVHSYTRTHSGEKFLPTAPPRCIPIHVHTAKKSATLLQILPSAKCHFPISSSSSILLSSKCSFLCNA